METKANHIKEMSVNPELHIQNWIYKHDDIQCIALFVNVI